MRRKFILGTSAFIAAAMLPRAFAQSKEFPSQPIRIINPYAPGGSSDVLSRLFARPLEQLWGQPVIVESHNGAGGTVGSAYTAKAAPDGYTVQLGSSSFAIAFSLYESLPFSGLNDFTPIIHLGDGPLFLVVLPSLGVSTLAELIALARAKPGKLNYGSSGSGTSLHIAAELFKQMSNTDISHIPYRGGAPAMVDFLAGRVQLMFMDIAAVQRVKSGEIKALAIANDRRSQMLPEVPTMAEAGLPGYKILQWYGIIGPRGIPQPVVAKLNDGFNRALNDPQVVERLQAAGIRPVGGPPGAFGKLLAEDVEKYRQVVETAKIPKS